MANKEHLAKLKEGVEAWNVWRKENPRVLPDLAHADLKGADLKGANLTYTDLASADLKGANLTYTDLASADLEGASLVGARLTSASLFNANLNRADLTKAQLGYGIGMTVLFSNMVSTRFLEAASLKFANLRNAVLVDANLVKVDLGGADLTDANLSGANFDHAILHSKLHGADLSGTKLSGADLGDTDLRGVSLSGISLVRANLRSAKLGDVDLTNTNLTGADLRNSNLSDAHLEGANLTGANLTGANLTGANLTNSTMIETAIVRVDLSSTHGLDNVRHLGPSSIDTHTFKLSKGRIPEAFLKNCGLSPWERKAVELYNPDLDKDKIASHLITNEVSHLRHGQSFELNLFMCHSHQDIHFVKAIEEKLDAQGVSVYRDVRDSISGLSLEDQITKQIEENDVVLAVLSERSVKRPWVRWEVNMTLEIGEKQKRRKLCPISLDDAWITCDWPGRLLMQVKDYCVLDFSGWKEEAVMNRQYQRLVAGFPEYERQKTNSI